MIEIHHFYAPFFCQEQATISIDPVETIDADCILHIFSYLNLASLAASCCVNKTWRQWASTSFLWRDIIYKELAFSSDKWAECLGQEAITNEDKQKELSSLSELLEMIIQDYRCFHSHFPKIKARKMVALVRLPRFLGNEPLTLQNIGAALNKLFPVIKQAIN